MMNRANRLFWLLVVVSSLAFTVVSLAACGVVAFAFERMATVGLGGVVDGGYDLRAPLFLSAVALLAAVLALASVHRQLVATERLARAVRRHRASPPPHVAELAATLRLWGRIDVVDAKERFSFTYGFLRPRIVVSRGLIEAAAPDELRAVVEHEAYHVRNLDPLKMVAARALPTAFFFLPVLRQLQARYLLARELAADQRAVVRCGTKPLAGALIKAMGSPAGFESAAGAALGGTALLPARVGRLETGQEPADPPLSRQELVVSAIGALVLVGAAAWAQVSGPAAHAHAPPIGASTSAAGVAATGLCSAVWAWLGWRVVAWLRARPR